LRNEHEVAHARDQLVVVKLLAAVIGFRGGRENFDDDHGVEGRVELVVHPLALSAPQD
jgi:hypothetical protein